MSSAAKPPANGSWIPRLNHWLEKIGDNIRAGGMLLAAVFCLAGAVREVRQQVAARWWLQVPCKIEVSEVFHEPPSSGDAYVFHIRYRYLIEGESHTSERLSFEGTEARKSDPGEADALVRKWPVGAQRTCWVNPRQPGEAVLDRVAGWEISVLLLGLSFLMVLPHFSEISSSAARWGSLAFALASALLTSACFCGLTFYEISHAYLSRDWPAVPCEIVKSRIAHTSDFHPDVVFRWERDGQTYRSAQAGFQAFWGGLPRVEKFVAAHPAGSRRVCYVNPHDPSEAVLDRDWHLDPMKIFGLSLALLSFIWVVDEVRTFRRKSVVAGSWIERLQMEIILPGYATGSYGWLLVSVVNVVELGPIAWREWQRGGLTTYVCLFLLAAFGLFLASNIVIRRWRERRRLRLVLLRQEGRTKLRKTKTRMNSATSIAPTVQMSDSAGESHTNAPLSLACTRRTAPVLPGWRCRSQLWLRA